MQVHGAESRFQNPTDRPSSPFFERKLAFQTEGLPQTQRRDTSDRKEKKIGKKRLGKDKSFVTTLRPLTFFHAGSHSPNGELENPRASGNRQSALRILLSDTGIPRTPASRHSHQIPNPTSRHPPRRSSKICRRAYIWMMFGTVLSTQGWDGPLPRQPPSPLAFRDDVRDCIERNWRHKGRRAQHTGMGWVASRRLPPSPSRPRFQPACTDPSSVGHTLPAPLPPPTPPPLV